MSQTTISITVTNPALLASVLLTVVRNDTGATLLANQPMTLSGSTFSYTLIDPTAGLTYTATVVRNYTNGESATTTTQVPGGGGATSYYASQTDLENKYHRDNIAAWSNISGVGGDPDENRVKLALDYASGYIDDFFQQGPYAVPLIPQTAGTKAVITDWAVTIAAHWLYNIKGLNTQGKEDNQYQREFDRVNAEMKRDFSAMPTPMNCQLAVPNMTTAPSVVPW